MARFLTLLTLILLLGGCGQRREFVLKNELKPLTPRDLLEIPVENLDRVDVGRMNIICARNVTKSEVLDTAKLVAKLDEWASIAKRLEQKYLPAFEKNAARYDNSLAKFKAVTLALTIQQDLKCGYNMDLITSGAMTDMRSLRFFRNPEDVFISGLLKRRKGTCSSIPVLFVAIGRRFTILSISPTPRGISTADGMTDGRTSTLRLRGRVSIRRRIRFTRGRPTTLLKRTSGARGCCAT